MKKLNQQGIAGTLVALIIVLVLAVGGVGYYVWKMRGDSKPAGDTAPSKPRTSTKKEAEKPAPDPTADWAAYSNKEGQFSFKYPKTWVQATHPELCSPGIALFGASTSSVGVCASESFGQMSFISQAGDKTAENRETSTDYLDITSETFTINGVTGTKYSGTYKAPHDHTAQPVPAPGTKSINYVIAANGRTYTMSYQSANATSTYPDALNDFNTLVTKTFKFTP